MKQLEQLSDSLWVFQGSRVSFYGFPFTTRMTIIRLADRKLWIHSPEKLNHELQVELSQLGEVAYLISPNKLHHLFLEEWLTAYPEAKSYAAPGLTRKRPELRFDAELSEHSDGCWKNEILQTLFRGSPLMEEMVFFHQQSETLILTDLIENIDPDTLTGWQKLIARWAGILAPNGGMPLDWRLSIYFGDRSLARDAITRMIDWKPKRIIISHGNSIDDNGVAFLKRSFSWLLDDD